MISSIRVATGRKNYLAYEIQGTKGSVIYGLERMGEVQVYFKSDEEVDCGFRKVFFNPLHKGYSAFQPAGGIAIAYNDMKVLEVHELFSAITKGTKYDCTFEFGYKIDRTVAAILKSAKERAWVDINNCSKIFCENSRARRVAENFLTSSASAVPPLLKRVVRRHVQTAAKISD
ncbi:MAG: hypothetical protein IJL12_01520 [Selenomonadaceae bacterium]|nr:hypothetical protein [Selenomonadaceae bacterium]